MLSVYKIIQDKIYYYQCKCLDFQQNEMFGDHLWLRMVVATEEVIASSFKDPILQRDYL